MKTYSALLFGLLAPTLVYPAMSFLMAHGLTRTRRLALHDTPDSVGLDYREIAFPSADRKVSLYGWLIPPVSVPHRWIILLHGYSSHRGDPAAGMLGLAHDLHMSGFGLLTFDMRGCGASRGRGSVGFHERMDLLGAIAFLERAGVDRRNIGVLGFSLGGAVALTACDGNSPVGAIVADSAFADLWEMIRRFARGAGRPLALFHPGMQVVAKWLYGIDLDKVSPASAVARSSIPLLVIHGERDKLVPPSHAAAIAAAANGGTGGAGATLWVVPGAGHAQGYRSAPGEYARRVVEFFCRNLGVPSVTQPA